MKIRLALPGVARTGATRRKPRQGHLVVAQLRHQAHHGGADVGAAGLITKLNNPGQFGRAERPRQWVVEGIWLCHAYPADDAITSS